MNACPDCRSLTSGDCGKHGFAYTKYAVPKTVVTTRQVPMTCGVCNGQRYVPELPDDPECDYMIKCEPCDAKGWLWITENVTERYDGG